MAMPQWCNAMPQCCNACNDDKHCNKEQWRAAREEEACADEGVHGARGRGSRGQEGGGDAERRRGEQGTCEKQRSARSEGKSSVRAPQPRVEISTVLPPPLSDSRRRDAPN